MSGIRVRCHWALLLLGLGSHSALAYDGALHQELTFLAARSLNACIAEQRLKAQPLTPLQVRYVAKTNRRQAQRNLFGRIFRWQYYDREGQRERSWLWLIDTRFHGHFNELSERLARPRSEAAFFSDLGRIANYVQDVTSPAHAVPVYTGRFWRFSLSDRFDGFRVDKDALAGTLTDLCEAVLPLPDDFQSVLRARADETLAAVRAPIPGMPAQWSAFWRPSKDPASFGDYGRAGNNFGRAVQFRCADGARCVLLEDDPLYRRFALARHRSAVIGTVQAMLLAQLDGLPATGAATGP
ncbi:MAG: hypothetical protein AAGI15_11200 [Pseudomonadota bacterium]